MNNKLDHVLGLFRGHNHYAFINMQSYIYFSLYRASYKMYKALRPRKSYNFFTLFLVLFYT